MRVAVAGAGAREHALALALARSPSVSGVAVVPGNPGIALLAGGDPAGDGPPAAPITCVDAGPGALDADLWVIGPEAPLVAGLADRLRAGGARVLGPGAGGARLEGSKEWMKSVLTDAGVPTATWRSFGTDQLAEASAFLRSLPPPWVVKTDGLAAGKGVLVTEDIDAAEEDLRAKLSGAAFGDAGRRVVVEEGLRGVELSLMALCDGRRAVALAPARDHKRLGDADTGPNTGGMGAYSPVPDAGPQLVDQVMASTVEATLGALRDRGVDYRGVLYAGLMLTPDGPRVIEINVRFGDPETQVVLARWEGDVASALDAAARGDLSAVDPPRFGAHAAVNVVLAAPGYPGAARTGDPIDPGRLLRAAGLAGVSVLAAGVAGGGLEPAGGGGLEPAGVGGLQSAGGRVLGVTGVGPTLGAASRRAYAGVELVAWPGCHYRSDIASGPAPGP